MTALWPCEQDVLIDLNAELRAAVVVYDKLMAGCYARQLTAEEQKELDELHGNLLLVEEEDYWTGPFISPLVVEMLREIGDYDFPMIRYTLGMLPGQRNNHQEKAS